MAEGAFATFRYLPDGNIEYHGRIDNQVKIRGNRIELGEIENVLEQHESVRQALVLVKEDEEGNKALVGYVVADDRFEKKSVIAYLADRLPGYMIPAFWVNLPSFPLTPNGKIDKKSLPDPDKGDFVSNVYVAPVSETELKLAEVWKELLGVEKISVFDNFFERGGNSLLAMRMVSYIERTLLLTIPVKVLFQFTCIRDLSRYIEIQGGGSAEEKKSEPFQILDV